MLEHRINILVYQPDGTLIAQYLLGDGEHLIGRDHGCPIYLDSEHISNRHALLTVSVDGIFIEDFNSTTGTYLDGITVRGRLRIKPGQVLQLGELKVDLQPDSPGQIGPGSRLDGGRYTLIRLLGLGGFGEVWLAKDEQLEEEIALKKLPPKMAADAKTLSDMRREVQKSRALSHPNIIRIHDLVQHPGEDPLITMEYVDGTVLTTISASKINGIFSWEEIKVWMIQLCDALEYAHDEKIVHRDLKPDNLMITRDGRLKLADFGIAASMADSVTRSSESFAQTLAQGFVSGTVLYMSPQQMGGGAPQATDDIYAFGSTVYELLTGKPPFYTGKVDHQILSVTPKPMNQRLAEFGFENEIPGYVNKLVMACLAKKQEGRPASSGAIRVWIESEGKAKGALSKVSTKTLRMKNPAWGKREAAGDKSQGKAIPYVMAAIAIVIVVWLGIWLKGQIEGLNEENAGSNKHKSASKKDFNDTVKPTQLFVKKQATPLWKYMTESQVFSSPAVGTDGTVYVGSGDNKVYALNGKTGVKKWEFQTGAEVDSSPAIGADGTIYVGSWDKKIYALDDNTGAKKWEFETGHAVRSSPAVSAGGTVYVGSRDNKVYALNGKTGTKKWEFETGDEVSSSPAIDSDGNVYVGSWDKKVYALYGKTGAKKWEFETEGWVWPSPAIGTDGTVYIGSNDSKVYALYGNNGTVRWKFSTEGPVQSSPTIGADGTIYIGSRDNKIYALDGKNGAKRWEFKTGNFVWASPAVGIDGTVYVGSWDKKFYALNGNTGDEIWVFETDGEVSSSPVIWSDGTVYFGSTDNNIYAISTTSKNLANSSWPMRGQNFRHTGQMPEK